MTASPGTTLADPPAPPVVRALAPLMVAVVTLGAFLPSLQNDFVRFDDHINLLENPAYRGLG